GNSKAKVVVPQVIKNDLLAAAKSLESAARDLAQKGNFFEDPVRMRRELLAAAGDMRKLAQGRYKKSYDDNIHKYFANAFLFGIAWARDEDGNYHRLAH